MSREQPEQQAPPVQRLRIRYAKRGRLRFVSQRDFSRAFERAIFRARVPMAYSSGFNPHPRISYAGAAPTGAASEAEYLEIGLREIVDPAEVAEQLREALPDGLDVLEVVAVPDQGRVALADLLTGSRWLIDVTGSADEVTRCLADFLARDEVLVERMTKKGLRSFDSRAAVIRAEVGPADSPERVRLDLVLRHTVPAVRPDDVLTALGEVEPGVRLQGPLYTRLVQGRLDEASGEIADPFAG